MPFVEFTDGTQTVIKGVYNMAQSTGQLFLPDTDARVITYLNPPPGPDKAGFIAAAIAQFGALGINTFCTKYPLFFFLIDFGDWTDWQTLVLDAKTKAVITAAQYTWLQGAAATFHFPVTLP